MLPICLDVIVGCQIANGGWLPVNREFVKIPVKRVYKQQGKKLKRSEISFDL